MNIPEPEARLRDYPHQFSGGMRQRAMIAMALACEPKLLIADEPTTALDVTVQAQILDLLRTIREESDTAIILITHDLGMVAEVADDIVVMYAGKVVEEADVFDLFDAPSHPYTQGLLNSLPLPRAPGRGADAHPRPAARPLARARRLQLRPPVRPPHGGVHPRRAAVPGHRRRASQSLLAGTGTGSMGGAPPPAG